jgi:putative Mn2+ efflux pump MntP
MLSIFLIGLALSMDAFSIAISIGISKIEAYKLILIPVVVGVMHFIMPLIGAFLGDQIFNLININPKFVVSIILFYLAILMFLDRKNEKSSKISSVLSIFLFAFSVSIDSFSVGIGLSGLTDNYFLAFLTFAICSSCITYMGLILGKYSVKILKEKAVYLGVAILIILAIVNMCQVFIY